MAVAFDAQGHIDTGASSTSTSLSGTPITIGSGSNRAIAVCLAFGATSNALPTGITVTCGGVAMTAITNASAPGNAGINASVIWFGLVAPASGTPTIAASWTGARGCVMGAISVTGADQTGGATTFAHGTSHVTGTLDASWTITITSAVGNLTAACFADDGGTSISSTSATQDFIDAPAGTPFAAMNHTAGSASNTMTATPAASEATTCAGFDFVASAAATFVPSNPQRAIAVGVAAGWPAQLVPPFLAKRLVPPPTGPVVSLPPLIGAKVPLPVQVSWIPPLPTPPVARNLTPSSAPIVAFVPVGKGIPAPVLEAWLPPPPRPPVAKLLVPPISGPAAQPPPPSGGAEVPQAVLNSWSEAARVSAAQLPTLNQKLVQPAGIVQCGEALRFALSSGNAGAVSITINVPPDTEFVAVGWCGFDNTANFFSSGTMTFTKGGADSPMTIVSEACSSVNQSTVMFWQVLPDTGPNKSLKFDWFGAAAPFTPDALCSVTFWKGIDTSDPVRADAGGLSVGLSPPYTSNTLVARSGDRIVAWAGAFVGTGVEGTADTWSNLDTLTQLAAAGKPDGAWATGYPSGDTTVALSTATNWQDGGITAISLKPAPVPLAVYPKRSDAILYSHILPPPSIIVARSFNPTLFGSVADNPPLVGARIPLAVQIAWTPPPPAPLVAINLEPPISGPTPDNPPIVGSEAPLAISIAWIPPPPMPIVIDNLVPPISGPPVNNPPILGARIPIAVSVSWIPPPPMPIVAINLEPPIGGPPVDNPPFVGRMRLSEEIASPLPYDLLVQRKGIPQAPVVATYLSPTATPKAIYFWWQQTPFAIQLPRNLTPPISFTPDNPPLVTARPRWSDWSVDSGPLPPRGSMVAPLIPPPAVVSVNFTSFFLMGVG